MASNKEINERLIEEFEVKECPTCFGSGRVQSTPIATVSCETCLGTGVIK